MSDCFNVPLFIEVMAPALETGSTLQDILFSTINGWGFRNRDVIGKFVCDFCSGVAFYIESVNGKDYVIARTAVKRGKVDVIVGIIKEALVQVGVDVGKLSVRVYDPCECKC